MISDYVTAVTADSSATSHPLVRTVESPLDVQQYSSSIVYSKVSLLFKIDVKLISVFKGGDSHKNARVCDGGRQLSDWYPKLSQKQ